jgi:DNA-binding LacI/PurR family transcriptional regulator
VNLTNCPRSGRRPASSRNFLPFLKAKQLKYKQVELELRQLAKTLPPGAKLPAERDLAIEYECNFLTVRKALKHLVDDGLIVRRTGSGTFIAEEPRQAPPAPATGNRLGVLVFQEGNAYSFAVLQAIAHVALTERIDLRSCWVRDFKEDALRQAETLVKEGCCALTLPWFPLDMVESVQGFVRHSPVPVSLPMVIPGLEKYCFEETHLFGTTILSVTEGICRYFAGLGHQKVAFLGPDTPGDSVLQQKLGAYTCFTSRENLPTLCGLVGPGSAAMDQLAERWKAHRGELAIVSYDDEHALRFMTAMHKIGLGAPGDFAIAGYNNTDASHYSDPPLTTVRQNFNYIGKWLVRSALALAEGGADQSREAPDLEMLVRETCGGREGLTDGLAKSLERFKLRVVLDAPTIGAGSGLGFNTPVAELEPASAA